jgi:hypothetical protein
MVYVLNYHFKQGPKTQGNILFWPLSKSVYFSVCTSMARLYTPPANAQWHFYWQLVSPKLLLKAYITVYITGTCPCLPDVLLAQHWLKNFFRIFFCENRICYWLLLWIRHTWKVPEKSKANLDSSAYEYLPSICEEFTKIRTKIITSFMQLKKIIF